MFDAKQFRPLSHLGFSLAAFTATLIAANSLSFAAGGGRGGRDDDQGRTSGRSVAPPPVRSSAPSSVNRGGPPVRTFSAPSGIQGSPTIRSAPAPSRIERSSPPVRTFSAPSGNQGSPTIRSAPAPSRIERSSPPVRTFSVPSGNQGSPVFRSGAPSSGNTTRTAPASPPIFQRQSPGGSLPAAVPASPPIFQRQSPGGGLPPVTGGNINAGGGDFRARTLNRGAAPGASSGVPSNPPAVMSKPIGVIAPPPSGVRSEGGADARTLDRLRGRSLERGPATGGAAATSSGLPSNPPAVMSKPIGVIAPPATGVRSEGGADARTLDRLRGRSLERGQATGGAAGTSGVLPINPPANVKPLGGNAWSVAGPKGGGKGPDSDSAERLRNRLIDRSRGPASGAGAASGITVPGNIGLPGQPAAAARVPNVGGHRGPAGGAEALILGPKPGGKGGVDGPSLEVRGGGRRGPDGAGSGRGGSPRAEVRLDQLRKSGEFSALGRTETAKHIQLDKQFQMHKQGDVARRMALTPDLKHIQNLNSKLAHVHVHNAHNPHAAQIAAVLNINGVAHAGYHGWISPAYHQSCFRHHYFGPSFFTPLSWYPHWSPWVSWSWGYHCHMYWDPRPLWCRPIFYEPAPIWIYRPMVVVWAPLPETTSGTWVDVARPVVVENADLQLLAVRFVDPGHPEEKLGPRYRVWFRNNGTEPITQPFNVAVLAANSAELTSGALQAGVRVAAIDAGDMQAVDVRLPAEVFAMNRDANGAAIPFTHLHVVIDPQQEINDRARQNNGAALPRGDVLPVDPATFEARPARATFGGEVLLAGEGYGPGPGRVVLTLDGVEMDAQILGWYDLGVRLQLPQAAAPREASADITVIRADGAAANPARIVVSP